MDGPPMKSPDWTVQLEKYQNTKYKSKNPKKKKILNTQQDDTHKQNNMNGCIQQKQQN